MPDTNVCAPPVKGSIQAEQAAKERLEATEVLARVESITRGVVDHDNVLDIREVCAYLRAAWFDLAELEEYGAHVDATLKCVLEENRRHA